VERNVSLYPWFQLFRNLLFWQALWFLYFQNTLSAAEAILLYAVYDVATTVLEVPSGYMSDRIGRRATLIAAAIAGVLGSALLAVGDTFWIFALGQIGLGASAAFVSGTDNALLYESLSAADRAEEVEAQELRSLRFGFAGLALSALSGGAMALYAPTLPFWAAALAFVGVLWIAVQFTEPPHVRTGTDTVRLAELSAAFSHPVLIWLFALGVLMYGFSHVPFVFGQPFILDALSGIGLSEDAPLVSGAVTSVMMLVPLGVSLVVMGMRRRLGLGRLLLLAFALQIFVIAALSLSNTVLVIAVLVLRLVPDAMSSAFIVARIQPLLNDSSRATFMSVKSLVARLVFAATLFVASHAVGDTGQLNHAEISVILRWYAAGGLVCLALLWVLARRIPIEPENAHGQRAQTVQE
jgi:MFS family permease